MKKRLFLFPLIAGFVLSGCTFTFMGKEITIKLPWESSEPSQDTPKDEGEEEQEEKEEVKPPVIKEEFGDYKLAKSVKEGGEYILGVYRQKENKMRFFNGDYHRDSKGAYPYYINTVVDTTVGAAKVTVHMVSDDEFTLLVSAPDQVWDNKYIGVYPADSSYGNKVMSIALLDSPDQASYDQPIKDGNGKQAKGITNLCSKFKLYETYANVTAYGIAAPYQYPEAEDQAYPKFLGTGHKDGSQDLTSIDCKASYAVALDGDQYDLAHLYELK